MTKEIRPVEVEPVTAAVPGKVKGRRAVVSFLVILLLILAIGFVSYTYIIPRVTIDLKTVYHEATAGGGTGGLINLNTKISNTGTVDANDCQVNISIYNSSEELLTAKSFEYSTLSPGEEHELKLISSGNCLETFHFILEVEFEANGNEYYERYNYKTHEDAMNIGFEDQIFEWGF